MCPFNTAKKIKSTEKVVIFIEGGVARGLSLRALSYEKTQKCGLWVAVVFCENVFNDGSA